MIKYIATAPTNFNISCGEAPFYYVFLKYFPQCSSHNRKLLSQVLLFSFSVTAANCNVHEYRYFYACVHITLSIDVILYFKC